MHRRRTRHGPLAREAVYPYSPYVSAPIKGRGATDNREGRHARRRIEWSPDPRREEVAPGGGAADDGLAVGPATELRAETARRIISRNESPDIRFTQSINPYRGCEHGCIYCYARPTHSYLSLSPGLDFETKLFYKENAVALLAEELARPGYRCRTICIGANTDPYQPVERQRRLTRDLLATLLRHRHPLMIVTKSHLVLRDLDLLREFARHRLCHVALSVTTLDDELKRTLEPRAPSAQARLQAIAELARAGVPVGVLAAPVIPAVNDHEIEAILAAAATAGARTAGYALLRLPHEVAGLFEDWLRAHRPLGAARVLARLRAMRGGALYDARFGVRFEGEGVEAQLLDRRFALACRRLGLLSGASVALDVAAFRVPQRSGSQLDLDL